MTEQEWNNCNDPQPMLEFLPDKVGERKLRLFACACCRRIWELLLDQRHRQAVEIAERFAASQTTDAERQAAMLAAETATEEEQSRGLDEANDPTTPQVAAGCAAQYTVGPPWYFASNARELLELADSPACAVAEKRMRELHGRYPSLGSRGQRDEWDRQFFQYKAVESASQCDLLRHIIGNPFKPYPAPVSWPSTIVQLATALYEGQDCSFALHDALLEAGHPDLAEHFKEEQSHPKGCWALDVILGKK